MSFSFGEPPPPKKGAAGSELQNCCGNSEGGQLGARFRWWNRRNFGGLPGIGTELKERYKQLPQGSHWGGERAIWVNMGNFLGCHFSDPQKNELFQNPTRTHQKSQGSGSFRMFQEESSTCHPPRNIYLMREQIHQQLFLHPGIHRHTQRVEMLKMWCSKSSQQKRRIPKMRGRSLKLVAIWKIQVYDVYKYQRFPKPLSNSMKGTLLTFKTHCQRVYVGPNMQTIAIERIWLGKLFRDHMLSPCFTVHIDYKRFCLR